MCFVGVGGGKRKDSECPRRVVSGEYGVKGYREGFNWGWKQRWVEFIE